MPIRQLHWNLVFFREPPEKKPGNNSVNRCKSETVNIFLLLDVDVVIVVVAGGSFDETDDRRFFWPSFCFVLVWGVCLLFV